VEDWVASKSTIERVSSAHFYDFRILVTNRLLKCQDCERMTKKNSGDVESGHNLSPEELSNIEDDKVCYNVTCCQEYFLY
jgi:hypothetical protein